MNLRFRLYYGDGSMFEGAGFADAIQAPTNDVQVAINEEPWRTDGKHGVQHGHDVYVWRDEGGWYGMDQMGFWHYMAEVGKPKYAIFGRSMARNDAFHDCLRRAMKEGLGE